MISFAGFFADRRVERRADDLFAALSAHRCVSIRRLASDWAEQIAFYRLLGNDALTLEALTGALTARTETLARQSAAGHLLCIQDTSQFNFEAHAGRLGHDSGLGVIGDNQSLGFFLHPTLVVEAHTGHALGLSHVKLWTRPPKQPDKHARGFKRLPIEQKESFRWLESVIGSRATLPAARMLTTVADRESDLYDLFYRLPAEHAASGESVETHALVRSRSDRRTRQGALFALLAAAPSAGEVTVTIRGNLRQDRRPRQARLAYRYRHVHVLRPTTCNDPEAPDEVALWAVEVEEVAATVPEGAAGIHWRLLTTHRVESFAQARCVVGWYQQRWPCGCRIRIEQLFRVMKTDGFALETSEIERGASLLRLAVLVLGAALDVMRLMLADREGESQPLAHVFTEAEAACLQSVSVSVQGRTSKQQNPHAAGTLAWAGWVVARLGGWKGYPSQRRAGPIVYHRGLLRFRSLCEGWTLARGVVYTP